MRGSDVSFVPGLGDTCVSMQLPKVKLGVIFWTPRGSRECVLLTYVADRTSIRRQIGTSSILFYVKIYSGSLRLPFTAKRLSFYNLQRYVNERSWFSVSPGEEQG
jgi:hypothetical protein